MTIYSYRDLEVYQEGFHLALEIHQATKGFPEEERYGVVSQIRRSSKSVCALIAEGFGRKESSAEFRRYVRMAHGSVQETKVWLEFAGALDYLVGHERLWQRYDVLGKRLYSLLDKWK